MKKQTEPTLPESIRYRLDVVFATTALTVLAGILIPIPNPALDIVWICSVCLAAAVILISAAAKNCRDLQGFGALLGALSLLRIGLIAMTVRKILLQQTGGVVVGLLGNAALHIGIIAAAIIGILIIFLGGWLVFLAASRMRRSVRTYADEVLPIKRAGLQADVGLHTISRDQARAVLEKIRAEMRLFGAIGAISVLMRCEALAGMVLILVALGIKAATDFMAAGYNPELIEILAAQTAGLAIIAVIPAVVSAWSCVALLGKDSLCLNAPAEPNADQGEFISLPNTSDQPAAQVELLNPDFVQKAQQVAYQQEKVVNFEPPAPKLPTVSRPIAPIQADNPETYYRQLTTLADDLPVSPGQAILLSCLPDISLGVQTAVNTAAGLSRKGRKTLLIDAEPQRSAVAKVFDLGRAETMTSPHKTVIENLFVFTAGDTESTAVKRTFAAIEKLHAKYDKILIYAPAMASLFAEKGPTQVHLVLFVKPEQQTGKADLPEALARCASLTPTPLV